MKIVRRGALPVGGESGLFDVRDRAVTGPGAAAAAPGAIRAYDVWPEYVDRVMSFVDVSRIRPLRVVIDAANGIAGAMLPRVLALLPIEVVRCYFDPDASFPNHDPNPPLPENREFIVAKTLAEGADLGVAFDGDAARCVCRVHALSAGTGRAAGRSYELFGEYRDRLVRTPEGWRIACREMTIHHEIGSRDVLHP